MSFVCLELAGFVNLFFSFVFVSYHTAGTPNTRGLSDMECKECPGERVPQPALSGIWRYLYMYLKSEVFICPTFFFFFLLGFKHMPCHSQPGVSHSPGSPACYAQGRRPDHQVSKSQIYQRRHLLNLIILNLWADHSPVFKISVPGLCCILHPLLVIIILINDNDFDYDTLSRHPLPFLIPL